MVTNNSCDEPTAASGKILQGQGIGTSNNFSTATYPSTASSAGKILRADGTNWVATTATYPDTAGTSGNVLTSDGTNWVSSTPTGGTFVNGYLQTAAASPITGVETYIFAPNTNWSTSLDGLPITRFYSPVAFTLTKIYGQFTIGSTLASAENCTFFIRVNGASPTNVSTTIQLDSTPVNFSNTGLSIAVAAGDYIDFGLTTGNWTTAPQNIRLAFAWSS